jgi:hypothetical protein
MSLIIDSAIASTVFASRVAVHRTLGLSPGALSFQRDMLPPIPILADFELIRQRRQALIDYNTCRENRRRIYQDYEVGDEAIY